MPCWGASILQCGGMVVYCVQWRTYLWSSEALVLIVQFSSEGLRWKQILRLGLILIYQVYSAPSPWGSRRVCCPFLSRLYPFFSIHLTPDQLEEGMRRPSKLETESGTQCSVKSSRCIFSFTSQSHAYRFEPVIPISTYSALVTGI